jgi:hypothetical protein
MLCSLLQGRTVGVPARSYIYVTIQPTNANYAINLVPWARFGPLAGLSLHFMYSANANMNFRTGVLTTPPPLVLPLDYVPQSIDVEFEGPSAFTVPFDGSLTYTGGNLGVDGQIGPIDFKTWIYYDDRPCSGRPSDPIDTSNYAPMFHWLKHYPINDPPDTTFVVPDNHTYLLAQNSTNTVTVNGVLAQPGTNSPGMLVSPGDVVQAVAPLSQVLITGWLG